MGGWQVAGGRPSWGATGVRSKSSGRILQREVLCGRASQRGSRGQVCRTERWGKGEGGDQRLPSHLGTPSGRWAGSQAKGVQGQSAPAGLLTCFPSPLR